MHTQPYVHTRTCKNTQVENIKEEIQTDWQRDAQKYLRLE